MLLVVSDHEGLLIKILRYTYATTSKYSSKISPLSKVTNGLLQLSFTWFYNTNTCIVKLTNCLSVALNPFNTETQPSGNETTALRP